MKTIKCSLVATAFFISATANAAIIDDGIYTIDTNAGKRWLDVPETTNCTYSVMSSGGMCNGYDLSTWTFGTLADVYELWGNAGISIENTESYSVANTSEIRTLINLVGITHTNNNVFYGVNGYVSSTTDQVAQLFVNADLSRDYAYLYPTGPALVNVGGWFYQPVSSIPVPAAAWLFGSGLLGLMAVARRRKA